VIGGDSYRQSFRIWRVGGGVPDGVLYVPMSQDILNQSRVRALVGKLRSRSVAQHEWMGAQRQGCGGAVFPQGQIDGGSVQRFSLLTDEKCFTGRFHPGAFCQPYADDDASDSQLVYKSCF